MRPTARGIGSANRMGRSNKPHHIVCPAETAINAKLAKLGERHRVALEGKALYCMFASSGHDRVGDDYCSRLAATLRSNLEISRLRV